MIKIIGKEKEYEFESNGEITSLNGQELDLVVNDLGEGSFHLIHDNKNYNVEVVNADYQKKEFEIRVNGQLYSLGVQDRFDALLKELGMDNLAADVAEDLKAPMPGLVLGVNVQPGDSVTKGDTLLVLEAMKMENSIKSSSDGVVKAIPIEVGQAVEKNQVLISFE